MSLKYFDRGLVYNESALVRVMAWGWKGIKPLSDLINWCIYTSFGIDDVNVIHIAC